MDTAIVTSRIHLRRICSTEAVLLHTEQNPNASRRTPHNLSLNFGSVSLDHSSSTRFAPTMPNSQGNCNEHQEQWHQRRSAESAGILLVTATVHMACWLLVGSIGWAKSPQLLSDDPIVVVLILLWFTQIATGGCLLAVVAPSLAVSSTAAIIGATTVAIYRTLMASHGNGAVWSFWISAGAYAGIAAEAVLGILQMSQDGIAHRVQINTSRRPT